jgi:hypothetical protein
LIRVGDGEAVAIQCAQYHVAFAHPDTVSQADYLEETIGITVAVLLDLGAEIDADSIVLDPGQLAPTMMLVAASLGLDPVHAVTRHVQLAMVQSEKSGFGIAAPLPRTTRLTIRCSCHSSPIDLGWTTVPEGRLVEGHRAESLTSS